MVGAEIFKLDENLGEDLCHGFHKLVHELIHFLVPNALLSKAQIQWILKIFGVIGPQLRSGLDENMYRDT